MAADCIRDLLCLLSGLQIRKLMIILLLDSYPIISLWRRLIWPLPNLCGPLLGFSRHYLLNLLLQARWYVWTLGVHLAPEDGIQVIRVIRSAIEETRVFHQLFL